MLIIIYLIVIIIIKIININYINMIRIINYKKLLYYLRFKISIKQNKICLNLKQYLKNI